MLSINERNTLKISILTLLVNFPAPIILALMLNEIRNGFYKKTVQMVTYAPHFISTVVMCGMIILFLSPRGKIGDIYGWFGMTAYRRKAAGLLKLCFFIGIYAHPATIGKKLNRKSSKYLKNMGSTANSVLIDTTLFMLPMQDILIK